MLLSGKLLGSLYLPLARSDTEAGADSANAKEPLQKDNLDQKSNKMISAQNASTGAEFINKL